MPSQKNKVPSYRTPPKESKATPKMVKGQLVNAANGENTQYLKHNMEISSLTLTECDMTDPMQVRARILKYFDICAKDNMRPNVSGLGLAFGVYRQTIWEWATGMTQYIPEASRKELRLAYAILNAQMEDYMMHGKIHPVAGIFLMKNNFDYKDERVNVEVKQDLLGEATSAEEIKQKYLNAVDANYEVTETVETEDP